MEYSFNNILIVWLFSKTVNANLIFAHFFFCGRPRAKALEASVRISALAQNELAPSTVTTTTTDDIVLLVMFVNLKRVLLQLSARR
jgi:hypothetical protein